MIVAIDGPAGSGKSTTARAVARRLGYLYLDTGAMYRAVTLALLRRDLPLTDEAAGALMPSLQVDLVPSEAGLRVLLDGEDVSTAIRAPDVGAAVSPVSALPSVRAGLMEQQRRLARESTARGQGVVLDGRDIGTVVFPDADVKIFMVADLDARARRRQAELEARALPADLDAVREELAARDRLDRSRELAPLRKAEDAVELDTTGRSIQDQVSFVLDIIQERTDTAPV